MHESFHWSIEIHDNWKYITNKLCSYNPPQKSFWMVFESFPQEMRMIIIVLSYGLNNMITRNRDSKNQFPSGDSISIAKLL